MSVPVQNLYSTANLPSVTYASTTSIQPGCILDGLSLSVDPLDPLNLLIQPGRAFQGGTISVTGSPISQTFIGGEGLRFVWLTSASTVVTSGTTAKPPTGTIYLGTVKIPGSSITEITNSGVCYRAGGLVYRITTDSAFVSTISTNPYIGTLSDTPSTSLRFATICPLGTLVWDGRYYNRMFVGESPVLNVKWLGAVGDGATDDTLPIQAAIDLAGIDFTLDGANLLLTGEREDVFTFPESSQIHSIISLKLYFLEITSKCSGTGQARG